MAEREAPNASVKVILRPAETAEGRRESPRGYAPAALMGIPLEPRVFRLIRLME